MEEFTLAPGQHSNHMVYDPALTTAGGSIFGLSVETEVLPAEWLRGVYVERRNGSTFVNTTERPEVVPLVLSVDELVLELRRLEARNLPPDRIFVDLTLRIELERIELAGHQLVTQSSMTHYLKLGKVSIVQTEGLS